MVKNKINWKPVPVEDPNLNSEGLVAFEECTDYGLVNLEKPRKINRSKISKKHKSPVVVEKPAKKKRKVSSVALTPSKQGSSVETRVEINEKIQKSDSYLVWSNFGLPDSIIKALVLQGFNEPTLIQSLSLPAAVLGRRDIVGAAETGSGKTLAFGLPIVAGILNEKSKVVGNSDKKLYALVLTPTRELAVQVRDHLKAIVKFTDINIAVVLGGMAAVKQERILSKRPEIVVATPGRLWELIQQGNEHLSQINDIRYLAIDETDRMLEKGHFEELHNILERLNLDKTRAKQRQNFVFSATLTLVHDLPKYRFNKSKVSKMTPQQKLSRIMTDLGIKNPKIVDISQGGNTPATLTESRISCGIEEKDYYVYYFLQKHPGRTLIFCNSIGCVRRLANLLGILGCRPLPLHASMQQRQRLKNLERFRDDEHGILVATDVAARGLDIPKIEHVLHYQTPRTSESYVHRSGRTARATQQGLTVVLMEPSEIQNYIKICKTLNRSEDLPIFPVQEEYLKAVKQRVNLARELDKLELQIRKGNSEEGWLRKAAKEMDIIVDDFSKKFDSDEISSQKKLADVKRKQLTALLTKPIFPKGFSGKYPLISGEFSPNLETNESALQTVKNAVEKELKSKKRIPLYKPKKTANNPK
ncbi:ATP-dependent RNA helicase DDX24 [Tribolium castaneum]|uniref:ATP-dependent RNA helicase n=1 Tax=Tribolium castaneum TaxID=7070 RepID=D6WTX4_TRICA|nr:PREDICTED: ATP-dependent RNA helicase DDX24 [Tribolium castaneum]EFA07346.2 putative ATP-dependent RNA helicase Dbp45A-like Protein [Tribolium castaneum]|eukprot:XP_008200152.1 PREDICTED: ATP-dependent RNA helicase DDX24 [Tribolium castaneum]